MPAALARTLIVSLSLLTALGIAIYDNPQVKEWVEEQRRKIAEMLRSIGDELDPQSRQQAEAFAFEGRIPNQQESAAAANAVAVATGRDAQGDAVTRRLTMRSNQSAVDLEERRRLGREYLAKRNSEMLERKKHAQSTTPEASPSSTEAAATAQKFPAGGSFDKLVNEDGTLRISEKPLTETAPSVHQEARFGTDMLCAEMTSQLPSTLQKGLNAGTRFANPFGDEYEMSDTLLDDRSPTPKPPVPPKIALEENKESTVSGTEVQGSFPAEPEEQIHEDLNFDEQLARALSLSLAESEAKARALRQSHEDHDSDLVLAINESLRVAQAHISDQKHAHEVSGQQSETRNGAPHGLDSMNPDQTLDDELYTLSPQYTCAKPVNISPLVQARYDPVHEAAATEPKHTESSVFQSLATLPSVPSDEPKHVAPTSLGGERLVDIDDAQSSVSRPVSAAALADLLSREVATSRPTTASPHSTGDASSTGFASDSEADDFASLSSVEHTRPQSSARSEPSIVEVEDIELESASSEDGDMDGIHTPSSWTDVGSETGESERSESEAGDAVRL